MGRHFLQFGCILCFPDCVFSQNMGIDTSTPTRAKFEVMGAADATSGIFGGEISGTSLQRNGPGIGRSVVGRQVSPN
jgi:hypothetical protein